MILTYYTVTLHTNYISQLFHCQFFENKKTNKILITFYV